MASGNRETKFASTKLAILRSLVERIETQPLEDVSLKDLCRDAGIANATLFLYFPHKTAILDYFIQLLGAELTYWVDSNSGRQPPKQGIAGVFDYIGQRAEAHPNLMAEAIGWLIRKRVDQPPAPLTPAELALAFPDVEGIEKLAPRSLADIFAGELRLARTRGDLPPTADIDLAVFSLTAILLSTPPLARILGGGGAREWYRRQLDGFWRSFETDRRICG